MKIAIIGGGPAGLMCAGIAATKHKVSLFDKNNIFGTKLLLTGHGRCNVTNKATGDEFLKHVIRNPKFLISCNKKFSTSDAQTFFEENGVPLKEEDGGRMFPVSEKSADIEQCMVNFCEANKVKFVNNCKVDSIEKTNDKFEVKYNGKSDFFDAVVIATGGKSYSQTGSTGDGYAFAEKFGHTIKTPMASLVNIELKNNTKVLQGVSLKNVKLIVKDKNKKLIHISEKGDVLFDGIGLSGPLTIRTSSYIAREDLTKATISIDFCTNRNIDDIQKVVKNLIEDNSIKNISSVLKGLMPSSMLDYFFDKIKIDRTKKCNQITKEERTQISVSLKGLEFTIKRLGELERAFVTCGGVSVNEINPKTLESKLCKNLFFAGEVMDVDCVTGGFNLQLAFSTGNVVGSALAEME